MAHVELKNVGKSFETQRVLSDINLAIRDGEFLTLVGPSGCGKSTLIRIIAGLEPQTTGSVLINGEPIDHLRPHERRISMVFQSYALYPHMTAFGNIAVPMLVARLRLYERLPLIRLASPRRRQVMREVAAEVQAIATQLKIETLLDRKPAQLSGGQRQRVALGRAMVRRPDAFLMDEPLSNLDAKLRVHMRTELAELHRRMGATFIYVTHDQVEAMTMSDRVAMMDSGNILQLGTPAELYDRPLTLEVARFIGSPSINVIPAKIGARGIVEVFGSRLPIETRLPPGSAVSVAIRPESVRPHSVQGQTVRGARERPTLSARLRRVENLGAEQILYFDLPDDAHATIVSRSVEPMSGLRRDAPAELSFDLAACHIFAADGSRVPTIRKSDGEEPRRFVTLGGAMP